MAGAGGAHAGGLEDLLLQELLIRHAGDPLHQQRKQVIAGVGIGDLLSRGKFRLQLRFAEEAEDLAVAGDAVLVLQDVEEPVVVFKVIGHAAGV